MNSKAYVCLVAVLGMACSSPAEDPDPGPEGGKGGQTQGGKAGGTGGKGGAAGGKGGTGGKGGAGGSVVTGGQGGTGGGMMGGTAGVTGGMGGGAAGSGPSLDNGLVGHWTFDEGMGSVVKDISPNQNHGTVVEGGQIESPAAMAPTWVEGKKGKALQLDGVKQWVKVPSSDTINSTATNGAFTLMAWVKATQYDGTGGDYNFIISRAFRGTAQNHFALGVLSARPTALVYWWPTPAPQAIEINRWYHVAATFDALEMTIYVDGVFQVKADTPWTIAADITDVIFGADLNIDVVKEFWGGAIDEVRVYNRPLTAEEIGAIVASP